MDKPSYSLDREWSENKLSYTLARMALILLTFEFCSGITYVILHILDKLWCSLEMATVVRLFDTKHIWTM